MPEQKAPAKKPTAEKVVKSAEEGGKHCRAPKCKQPVRAKGYCRKHYMSWRRGKIGKKHRYNICSKEGCRKPTVAGGVCAEHKKGAVAEGAAAST